MNKLYIFLIVFFLLVFLTWQAIYLPKDFGSLEEVLFTVKRGDRGEGIASQLEEQDLIKSAFLFRLWGFLRGRSHKLQAGVYLLSPSMSMPAILKKISSGDVVKMQLTIPEGFRIEQINEKFKMKNEKLQFKIQNFKVADFDKKFIFLQDAPNDARLEGYLFPDTYQFSFTEEPEQSIIKKMLANFDRKLSPDLREEIKSQGKTIFEIITMASLLEKEVQPFEDRQVVAGILWKRRQNKIPLQVDATITYIIGKPTTRISREETKIDSPYNTYQHLGLPLGPICNPGLDSIRAAVYPKNSPYWYYLSTSDGRTIFSTTLEEHNVAKARYLK